MARAPGSAVGPVEADRVPQGAAKELNDGNAEGLRLDVEEGELDPRDGLGRDARRALAGAADHIPAAHLIIARVLPDEQRLQVGDGSRNAVRGARLGALAVARDAFVGLDLDVDPGPPARIDDQRFHIGDLHRPSLQPVRTRLPSQRPTAYTRDARTAGKDRPGLDHPHRED